jgi:undecaprenyl-diphosphatase
MPDWLSTLILGIVEGITEFLPISSTGHLLVAENWMKIHKSDLFNVVIQCGAVIAVLPLFPNRIKDAFYKWREPLTRDYFLKLILAFVITGVGGLILEKRNFKLENNPVPIGLAMLAGGVLFLIVEWFLRRKKLSDDVTWTIAVAVGVGQLIAAIFPGSSRSGTTILFSLLLGLSRPAATEFSFLVGIPTMLAAGGLKIYKQIHQGLAGSEDWGMLIMASIVAAVVSFIAVKWLLRYVQSHTFVVFGWYRIAFGVVILILVR